MLSIFQDTKGDYHVLQPLTDICLWIVTKQNANWCYGDVKCEINDVLMHSIHTVTLVSCIMIFILNSNFENCTPYHMSWRLIMDWELRGVQRLQKLKFEPIWNNISKKIYFIYIYIYIYIYILTSFLTYLTINLLLN